MTKLRTYEDQKEWLEANIGQVETKDRLSGIGYATTFAKAVLHHNGSSLLKIEGHALTRKLSLSSLFYRVLSVDHGDDYIQIGEPETNRISIDRQTLAVTQLPIPV